MTEIEEWEARLIKELLPKQRKSKRPTVPPEVAAKEAEAHRLSRKITDARNRGVHSYYGSPEYHADLALLDKLNHQLRDYYLSLP